MREFISNYGGSIIVGLSVLAVVVLIIAERVKARRSGKSSCGGDCAHCGCCGHAVPNEPTRDRRNG